MVWTSVERDERGVGILTIENEAKLNTLNTAVMTELIAAVEQLGRDPGSACGGTARRRRARLHRRRGYPRDGGS